MNFAELHHWNTNSYGHAFRIKKNKLRAIITFICLITPATNWMIPFIKKIVTQDLVYRYV